MLFYVKLNHLLVYFLLFFREEEQDLMSYLYSMDINFGLDNERVLEKTYIKLKEFQDEVCTVSSVI